MVRFVWSVGKIFSHGLLSFTLGVIRFAFSMGTVFGFIGMAIYALKWLILHKPYPGSIALCLAAAFGCFVVNVAIATLQRKLQEALARSFGPHQQADQAEPQEPELDYPGPSAPAPAPAPVAYAPRTVRSGPARRPGPAPRPRSRAWR